MLHVELLEDRRLLAFDAHAAYLATIDGAESYVAQPVVDPFARNAVAVDDMVARASIYPYIQDQIVVALETPTTLRETIVGLPEVDWSQRFELMNVELIAELMSVVRGESTTVSLVHLNLQPGSDVLATMQHLTTFEDVLWSSPNFYMPFDPREFTPNDPQYGNQYHHPLMKNNLAWDLTLGDASIVIGITDDGVQIAHNDLAPNIWVNPGEIPGNGIDDDGNGYIDDVNGWDFISNNNDPNPSGSQDHGTHVAGIAAARTNNSIGVAGTAGAATIMPLQFYNSSIGGSWTAAVNNATFRYAADNGAQIVTTSYNIDGFVGDPVFTAGLQYSYDLGVLHFNSSGNNNQLNPPRQAFEQTLLVANTTSTDLRSSSSNYGVGVDISAPGTSILSTVLNNGYGSKSGTSMASPNAAAAAALIWSHNPTWTREQVAAQLLATTDNIDAVNPAFAGLLGTGRVNSFAALTTTLGAPEISWFMGLPANGDSTSALNLSSFEFSFSMVMDATSVNDMSNMDLRASGPDGVFDTADDIVIPMQLARPYMVSSNRLRVDFVNGGLGYGNYRLTLSSDLTSPFGTPLDGDGDGNGGDDYYRYFSVAPEPPAAIAPLGSMIYLQQFAGQLASGESTQLTLDLDAGQTVTLHLQGNGGLVPELTVTDPGASVIFSQGGSSRILTQPLAVNLAGTYSFEIEAAMGTSGSFSLKAYLNGAVEAESVTLVENNSAAAAESLEPSAVALGGQDVTRLAVVGQLPAVTGNVVLSEDFESGSLNASWTTFSSQPQGRIRVSNQYPAAGGVNALLMDRSPSGTFNLNQAIWTIDLAGYTSPTLTFYHAEWGDEQHPLPLTFTGNFNGDGVSMSADGVTWHRLLDPPNLANGVWQLVQVNLAQAATNAGISLNSNFRLKFQQYDDFPLPTDGRGYDEIRISVPTQNEDWYSFDLAGGESATVAMTQLTHTANPVTLDLIAPDGTTVLASGVSAQNVSRVIRNYQHAAPLSTTETFYVRVGGISSEYSLVVTKNGDFDLEPNTLASPQDVSGLAGVLGHVNALSSVANERIDAFSYDLQAGQTVMMDAYLPGSGPYWLANGLDLPGGSALLVELLDPSQSVVASGSDSFTHVATVDGPHVFRVTAAAARGEYFLDIQLATVPTPGDFNQDGIYDCADIDALTAVIAAGTHDEMFDLTGDTFVNGADLSAWLAEAGGVNLGPGLVYLEGDANLDGIVDGLDFVLWNKFKFTSVAAWCSGDFNADGIVDGIDFSLWNDNKFTSSFARVETSIPTRVDDSMQLSPRAVDAALSLDLSGNVVELRPLDESRGVFTRGYLTPSQSIERSIGLRHRVMQTSALDDEDANDLSWVDGR